MSVRISYAACFTVVLLSWMNMGLWAQAGGDPETQSGVGKSANWDQVASHQHGSMNFTGKVVVSGGALLWDPIPVVVTCDGKTRFNTETDTKGRFWIDSRLGASEISPERPGEKRLVPAQLIGCTVRAVVEGFRSSAVTIANRSIMDDAALSDITLSYDEKAAGSARSTTTAGASKEALKLFEKARADANDNHPDKAARTLQKALEVYPQFAEAWYQLGKLQQADNRSPEAQESFAKAIAADPRFLPPYEHLALLAAQDKKWQSVVDATDKFLQLDPVGTPQIWYFNAVGNLNLGKKDVAERSAQTALAMDPGHVAPNTEQLLAVILAGRGAYADALAHLQNCLQYTPPGANADLMKQQVAQLEKVIPTAKR